METQFIILHEFNTKEQESFIHFLQYTDNEEIINYLETIISESDFDELGGDYIRFEINTKHIISETTVNEMIKCDFGSYYHMFSKCVGKMEDNFYDKEYINSLCGSDKAFLLDKMFFSIKIRELFTK